MRVHKRLFTLMETLFVLFLLGLFLGLVGINVNKAVHEQHFRSEVSMVLDTLRVAQYLMLISDNDVHVKFQKKDTSISIEIQTTCPLPKEWEKLLSTTKQLNTIHVATFTDHLRNDTPESGHIDIRFLSSGYVMSQGILRLGTAKSEINYAGLENFICLPGYPTTLVSTEIRPEEPDCYTLVEELTTDKMTSLMADEIRGFQAMRAPNQKNKADQ